MLGSYRGLNIETTATSAAGHKLAPSAMLDLEFAQFSHSGKIRKNNEDYLGHAAPVNPAQIRTHGWLFALADGVGGQDRGEVASRTAVEALLAGFRDAVPGELPGTLLTRLVKAANSRVLEGGLSAGPVGPPMATTIVACLLRFDRAIVAHVGDSRCYLVRRGKASSLTRDHTVAGEQVRLGVLSEKEAADSPTRHLLSRSLGNEMFVSVELSDHQVFAGDVLVLCSDGLHSAVAASEMADLIADHNPLSATAEKLVTLANERDGSDNISVQLVRIRGVERVGMYRGRPYKLR